MNKRLLISGAIVLVLAFAFLLTNLDRVEAENEPGEEQEPISLESPRGEGPLSVEEAIYQRQSTRSFSPEAVTKEKLGQLLWSAVGITVDGVTGATRAYPSAGGINPLSAYVVAGEVEGLEAGIYRYNAENHSLDKIVEGDFRTPLMEACYGQQMIAGAPVNIVLAGNLSQVESRYGEDRGPRYLAMDVGAAGQNIHLQAESLELGTVIAGAFHDNQVAEVVQIRDNEMPLYVMPVGHFLQ